MARPRMPNSVAKASGADIKNPQRYRGRSDPSASPLGDPPDYLTDVERTAWGALASEIPWLGAPDRCVVEITAKLRARLMTNPDMGVNALAQLRLCLSSLGATPVDRSRIAAGEDDDDPSGYLN